MKPKKAVVLVKEFVSRLLKNDLPKNLKFHNYRHTKEVVNAVKKLGNASGIGSEQQELLTIAAWFHDTGFTSKYAGHEIKSKEIASGFLKEIGYPEIDIKVIGELILATTMPQHPKNELERIICDADLWHLSSYNYDRRMNCLRKEIESIWGKKFLNKEWCSQNLLFIKSHQYQSLFGRDILEKRKQINIQIMEKRARMLGKEAFKNEMKIKGIGDESCK